MVRYLGEWLGAIGYGKVYLVESSLEYEKQSLFLPPEKIHSNGRVTISVNLEAVTELREIPLDAVRLLVRPGSRNPAE